MSANLTKSLFLVAAGLVFWAGCSDDHDHDHDHATNQGGHTSPYPSCQEIITACHEVDVADDTPAHACHEAGHDAKSDADCAPLKAQCLADCAAARTDAGAGDGG